jgi:hypothetical protein
MTISVMTDLRSAGHLGTVSVFALPASCAGRMARRLWSPPSRSFTGLDAVRGFAGDDYELAVVEEGAEQPLPDLAHDHGLSTSLIR